MGLSLKKVRLQDTAVPPDVRKRFAPPLSGTTDLGCAQKVGVPEQFNINWPYTGGFDNFLITH